ncbi:hypothetical protein [Aureimonas phyllosphaerae]|uniref:Uncharacterized protein n=1 Tax=Aureimonas phyllosphaerae TaxID=1166078 RepID=A0A7W6BM59_9HYPH|nr:hypothetical protein [Aureimonas phyllosphaerae]MBB3934431.1 hypothetical protein [Aureimonas phyllosphaerae]MBB3958353.1 hypothetical protein [Aureimonas phyllosphaerae]SFE95771.1 hypothetical protein SAMN05216566_101326 [Aureimonas phyllosphaerae]
MAAGRSLERRVLDKDELDLVAQTHHPAIRNLERGDLDALTRRLRERRDRAQAIANRRRGAARRGRGSQEPENSGMRQKAGVLAEALARLNKERTRREHEGAADALQANARRALKLKRANAWRSARRPGAGRTARDGMTPAENEKAGRIGSPMEAGRVSQFMRDAQAARDNRA